MTRVAVTDHRGETVYTGRVLGCTQQGNDTLVVVLSEADRRAHAVPIYRVRTPTPTPTDEVTP